MKKNPILPAYVLEHYEDSIKIIKLGIRSHFYTLATTTNEPYAYNIHNILCNDRKKLKAIAEKYKQKMIKELEEKLEVVKNIKI